MFAQVNGIKMHYVSDGPEDAPHVTLVTGIANDGHLWDDQASALKASYRVLRYDLRGQGQSQSTPGPYSIASLGDDLLGLWDALRITRSHLVGLGLGGAVSLGLAIDHPTRLTSVTACCCRAKMEPQFAQMWHGLAETVRQGGIEPIVKPTLQRWFSEDFRAAQPRVVDAVRDMIRSTSKEGYLGLVAAFLKLDLEDQLHRIRVPTLFLGGEEDRVGGPQGIMQRMADKTPGSRYVSVSGAAHIANLQNADAFNSHLRRFLDSHSPATHEQEVGMNNRSRESVTRTPRVGHV